MTFARRRQLLLVVGLCVWGIVWARALQLQVWRGDELYSVAYEQSERRVRLSAPRGEIVDRQGRLLAITVAQRSYFAYPDRESSTETLARHFSPVRRRPYLTLVRDWRTRHDHFTWMIRRCSAETAQLVDDWKLPGVFPTWEYERVYPTTVPGIAGPLGFVNDTLAGAAGLEACYDSLLRGVDGEGLFVADATGRKFALDPISGEPPQSGARLHLTLDARWQSILSEELAAAVEKWQAKSGMALLMDPNTGAIRAMVDIDPARPKDAPVLKNRLICDVFEPGSTFKIVSYAAALGDGIVCPGQLFDGGNGSGTFSGRTIRDDKRHGVLTVAEAFAVSSNVITGRIANRMESGRLDFWARRLGFGQPTGIDLPGESPGRIAVEKHSDFNIATRSIGHGVAVTALQLAVAGAAIANGGYLVRPHLVSATEFPDGRLRYTAIEGHRVLRPEVVSLLSGFMRRVVREGTAKTICDSLYPIAGKTGTAEKPNLAAGRYDKNKFMASFLGFWPPESPRLLGLIVLDEPEPIHYGGIAAAPVLLNTIRRGASFGEDVAEGMERFCSFGADTVMPPRRDWSNRLVDAVGPLVSTAEARTGAEDSTATMDEDGPEAPIPGDGPSGWGRLLASSAGQAIRLRPDSLRSVCPNVKNMPLRRATTVLRTFGVRVQAEGTGLVVAQDPMPDSLFGEERVCRLTLR